jgi:hypothetical protein
LASFNKDALRLAGCIKAVLYDWQTVIKLGRQAALKMLYDWQAVIKLLYD